MDLGAVAWSEDDYDEDNIVKRAATTIFTPLVRFVESIYGPRATGIDLTLCLFAGSWTFMMIVHPEKFDRGNFVGMMWLPDLVWIAFFGVLAVMHGLGLVCSGWRTLRVSACLLSAWIWLSVSGSLFRVELIPGVFTYAIIGASALCGALYLSGQPRGTR